MSAFEFADFLGIEDPRTMKLGMIAIDVDQENGYSKDVGNRLSLDNKVTDACLLFPMGMRESEEVNDNGLLFVRSWLNGMSFMCQINSVLDIRDINPNVSKWVNSRGVCSSDQIFAARSPQVMNTLFSCFKKYGSSKTTRLAKKSSFVEDRFKQFEENGGLIREWVEEPLAARYAIRSTSSKHKVDYFYMISGSELLMNHEELTEKKEKIANSLLGCHEAITKDAKKFKPFVKEMEDYKVWYAYRITELAKCKDPEIEQVAKTKRGCIRTMIGVSYIYNYLMYAKSVLGVGNFDVIEIKGQNVKEVDIDEVIEAYASTYKYFRNLAFLTSLA